MIETRVGRNDLCPCGSGKKFKKCCLLRQSYRPIPGDVSSKRPTTGLGSGSPSPPRTATSLVPPGNIAPGEDRVIGTTAEHPFYLYGKGWTPLAEINPGDWIRTDDGWVEVTKIEDTGRYETVYNLRVEDYHTYFVGGDDWGFGVWAHNQYLANDKSISGKSPSQIRGDRPKGWTERPAARGHGWVLVDENGIERIRYMYPNKNGTFRHEQTGYFRRQNAAGEFLDVHGTVVPDADSLRYVRRHIIPSGS